LKFYTRTRRKPEVIIVSLIDIFAILLIFVIVTTTFKTAQPAVTIKLPESKSAVASDRSGTPVVLSISDKEDLYLDEKIVSVDELAPSIERMRENDPKFALAMRVDKKVSYGFLIRVLDSLKDAGVKGSLSAFTDQKK
jgi:biopolymer transport protein ExbD